MFQKPTTDLVSRLSIAEQTAESLARENQSLKEKLSVNNNQRIDILNKYIQTKVVLEKLQQLASRDPLTELLNRRGFRKALHRQIGLLQRYTIVNGVPFVPPYVILFDLDRFKQVNDISGHPQGDLMLKAVAEILHTVFHRDSDILCRLGGDEFVVLCLNVTEMQVAERANELRKKIANDARFHLDGCVPVTASIGITEMHLSQDMTPEEMDVLSDMAMEVVDRALYRSKELGGRNAITLAIGNTMKGL